MRIHIKRLPYPASSQIFMGPSLQFSWSSSTASSLRCTVVQRGSARLFLLRRGMGSIPPGGKAMVGALVIFALQMYVGFHGRDHAGMSQPLLNEFPIPLLTFVQIGEYQLSCVGMAELVGMQLDARALGVVLKNALHRRHREGRSIRILSLT